MYSFLGGILIFVGCSLIGFSAARMYRLRVGQIEAFLKLISHVRAQIEYCRAPLDMILDAYECPILSGCGFLLMARELGVSDGFSACRTRLLLTDGEADELQSFFAGLGHHSADEECSHCRYFEHTIGEFSAHERAELSKRSKLCRTFGVLSGFLLAILLV